MHLIHKIKKYQKDYRLQYLYNCMTGCTIISRKNWIDKVLPFPTNSKYMIHDYWLGLVIALNGKVGYIEEPYILYRQHGKNQVGSKKASKTASKLEKVRNISINTRIGTFETYVMHEEIFDEKLRKQNKKALEYFKMLKNKKNFNFRQWGIFFRLYKYESFSQYIKNFMVLNLPWIVKIVFDLKHKK